MDVEEVMDQAEEPRSISDESDIESEREDQPASSKRKFQGSATYNTKYDPRWKQYPCIDAVKGDVYSFFCCTCSKKMSCKHMGISDVKCHIERAGHKMATAKEHQSKLAFVSSRDPIKKVGT